jgi:hypothetical protein
MTALTKNRNTLAWADERVLSIPIADNVHIFSMSMVAVNAAGHAIPAGASGTTTVVGRAEDEYDNTGTGHAVAALQVRVKQGVFKFGNSASGDLIAQANIFATVYAVDDQTVALTSDTGARKAAGICAGVDSDGVWVYVAAVH